MEKGDNDIEASGDWDKRERRNMKKQREEEAEDDWDEMKGESKLKT